MIVGGPVVLATPVSSVERWKNAVVEVPGTAVATETIAVVGVAVVTAVVGFGSAIAEQSDKATYLVQDLGVD